MAQAYPVVGAGGETHPRLEIRDLNKDLHQWTLFIKAMISIMDPSKDQRHDPALWQQMAGIHGEPYSPWSGDPDGLPGPVGPEDQGQWEGYCHHASAIFPTWHRVVMLLIEQSVVREAAKIAQQLVSQCTEKSEQVEWTKAANSLRFPFWDWTLPDTGKNGIPSILMSSTTQILDPTQPNPISVPNPLYSYQLNGINKCFDNPDKYPMYLQNWPQTYRWPDDKKPISEDNLANLQSAFVNGVTIFNKPRPNYTGILQEVHNLFTLPMCETTETEYHGNMWDIFSNTGTFDPDNPDKQPSDFGKYSQGVISRVSSLDCR